MRLALLVVVTMIAFAANSILNRLAITAADTGPLAFAALRLLSGALVLGALVIGQSGRSRLVAQFSASKTLALGAYMLGFSLAYTRLDAGLGALVLFGGVQVTMLAGAAVSGERLGAARLFGVAVAFSGLVWLLWPSGDAAVSTTGAGLMLVAALGWGAYSLLGRGSGDPLAATAASFLLAALPIVPIALVLWDGLTLPGAALAVISGAVTSGLGYALWYWLLPHLEASLAAVAQLSVPPIAIASGAVLLSEPVGLKFLLATMVVLGGVMIAVLANRPRS